MNIEELRRAIEEKKAEFERIQKEKSIVALPAGERAKRYAAQVGRNTVSEFADLADVPYLPFEASRYVAGKAAHLINPQKYKDTEWGEWLPRTGEKVAHAIDTATKGYTEPSTSGERLAESATRAVATIPGYGQVGKGISAASNLVKTPKIAKGLAATGRFGQSLGEASAPNVLGAAGSGLLGQAYLEGNPYASPTGLIGSSLAGGYAGALIPGMARVTPRFLRNPIQTTKRGIENVAGSYPVAKVMGFDPKKWKLAKDNNIPVTLGDVGGRLPQASEQVFAHTPGAAGVLEKKIYEPRLKKLAQNAGIRNAEDLELAVAKTEKDLAEKGAEGYHTAKSDEWDKLTADSAPQREEFRKTRKPVDIQDITGDLQAEGAHFQTPTEIATWEETPKGDLYQKLKIRQQEELALKNKNAGIKTPQEGSLSKKDIELLLENISPDYPYMEQLKQKLGGAPISPESMPGIGYAGYEQVLKQVREKMQAAAPKSDIKREYRDLYEKLRDKHHAFLEENLSGPAAQNVREANKMWAKYKGDEFQYLLHMTEADSVEKAFDKLASKNPMYMKIAMGGLPAEKKRDLFEAFVTDLGARQGTWSSNAFYTNWKALPEATRAHSLEPFGKAFEKNFDQNLKFMGEHKRSFDRIANTSMTAHTLKFMGMIAAYGYGAGKLYEGDAYPLFKEALAHLAVYGGARLMSNPRVMERMNKVVRAKNLQAKENFAKQFLKNPQVKGLIRQSAQLMQKDLGRKEKRETEDKSVPSNTSN